jgi:hypothetical protein
MERYNGDYSCTTQQHERISAGRFHARRTSFTNAHVTFCLLNRIGNGKRRTRVRFNLFPFRPMEAANYRQLPFDPFGLVLRSAHSMLNTIASKPFLTSVDKVLTCLLATTTKICTIA